MNKLKIMHCKLITIVPNNRLDVSNSSKKTCNHTSAQFRHISCENFFIFQNTIQDFQLFCVITDCLDMHSTLSLLPKGDYYFSDSSAGKINIRHEQS
jgi:hypothetical protein